MRYTFLTKHTHTLYNMHEFKCLYMFIITNGYQLLKPQAIIAQRIHFSAYDYARDISYKISI